VAADRRGHASRRRVPACITAGGAELIQIGQRRARRQQSLAPPRHLGTRRRRRLLKSTVPAGAGQPASQPSLADATRVQPTARTVGPLDLVVVARGHLRRIAAWARAYTPESLTGRQRQLLEAPIGREISDSQRQAEAMGSYEASPLWDMLTAREQALVRNPSTHRQLASATYPLSIGQLTTLTKTTVDQLRHWSDLGLIRAARTKGGHRCCAISSSTRRGHC
jgi:hypothetical protein